MSEKFNFLELLCPTVAVDVAYEKYDAIVPAEEKYEDDGVAGEREFQCYVALRSPN